MHLIASSTAGERIAVGSPPISDIAHQLYINFEAYCTVACALFVPGSAHFARNGFDAAFVMAVRVNIGKEVM